MLFRQVHAIALVASVLLGLVMLFGFDWARARFPIDLGPLTSATWGAWWIGLAGFGWSLQRHRPDASDLNRTSASIQSIAPVCVLLWTFWPLLAIHLLIHSNKLDISRPLAWPFFIVVVLQIVSTIIGMAEALRFRRSTATESRGTHDTIASTVPAPTSLVADRTIPMWMRAGVFAFVALSLYLGIKLLFTNPSGYTNPRAAYPEQVSVVAIRVFGFLYLAVGLAGTMAGISRTRRPMLTLARAGIPIVITILIASVLFLDRFDPATRSGSIRYIGVYLGILIAASILLLAHHSRIRNSVTT
jgi:hypothetical protein